MKTIISIIAVVLLAGSLSAQEYKVARSTGRLELYIGRVTVEGYSGNEIIFTTKDRNEKVDERSKGLKEINGLGLEDNTGLGFNVEEKGTTVIVKQLKKTKSNELRIMVPKGMTIAYGFESQYGGDVTFKNVESEIEVAATYNSVELYNVTGPLTVKTIYGNVDAVFEQNVKGPLSIVSVYGRADVTLPLSIKANIRMSTSYGELFASPEFKMEVERGDEDESRVNGKINGGGLSIDINCSYGKVYLRKK